MEEGEALASGHNISARLYSHGEGGGMEGGRAQGHGVGGLRYASGGGNAWGGRYASGERYWRLLDTLGPQIYGAGKEGKSTYVSYNHR